MSASQYQLQRTEQTARLATRRIVPVFVVTRGDIFVEQGTRRRLCQGMGCRLKIICDNPSGAGETTFRRRALNAAASVFNLVRHYFNKLLLFAASTLISLIWLPPSFTCWICGNGRHNVRSQQPSTGNA